MMCPLNRADSLLPLLHMQKSRRSAQSRVVSQLLEINGNIPRVYRNEMGTSLTTNLYVLLLLNNDMQGNMYKLMSQYVCKLCRFLRLPEG